MCSYVYSTWVNCGAGGGLLLQNFILITTAYNFVILYIYFIFSICLLKGNLGKGQKHYNI